MPGPAAAVAGEVRDAIAQPAGVGHHLSPGCALPLDVLDVARSAGVDTVRGHPP